MKIFRKNMLNLLTFLYICRRLKLPERVDGSNFSGKEDVYGRYLLGTDLANQSIRRYATRRPHWVYCTLPI